MMNEGKVPPHLLPFLMSGNLQKQIPNNPQELEANFLNDLLKGQLPGNPHQMNPQQLMQQMHQQKLNFTEAQILEQAKRSIESNFLHMGLNPQSNLPNTNNELMNLQQAAANHHAMTNGQQRGFKPFPEFEMNPALKQLRDIADARNSGPFPDFNPNAFNNGFTKSKH